MWWISKKKKKKIQMCLYNYQKTCIPKGKEQLYFQHHLCFGPEVSYVLCQKVIMQETGSTKDWIYWKFLTCATWQCNEVFKEGKSFKNKFVVYFVFCCFFFSVVLGFSGFTSGLCSISQCFYALCAPNLKDICFTSAVSPTVRFCFLLLYEC